jgi:hypothetical protein
MPFVALLKGEAINKMRGRETPYSHPAKTFHPPGSPKERNVFCTDISI